MLINFSNLSCTVATKLIFSTLWVYQSFPAQTHVPCCSLHFERGSILNLEDLILSVCSPLDVPLTFPICLYHSLTTCLNLLLCRVSTPPVYIAFQSQLQGYLPLTGLSSGLTGHCLWHMSAYVLWKAVWSNSSVIWVFLHFCLDSLPGL